MDERFRDAQRRATSGDPSDVARYYRERVRCGLTTECHLHFAAWIGDLAANIATGQTQSITIPELAKFSVMIGNPSERLGAGLPLNVDLMRFAMVYNNCPEPMTQELLRNLMHQIKSQVIAKISGQRSALADSMRFENTLWRSGWIPVLEEFERITQILSATPPEHIDFASLIKQAWDKINSGIVSYIPGQIDKEKEELAQKIRNHLLHQWGLH